MTPDEPSEWAERIVDSWRRMETARWQMHVAVTREFLEKIAQSVPFQSPSATRRDDAGAVMAAIEETLGVEDRTRRNALVEAEVERFVLIQAERDAGRQSFKAINPRVVGKRESGLRETIYTVEFDVLA